MAPQELLRARARGREPATGVVLAGELDRREQRRVAVLEAPRRRLRTGERRQQLDPAGGRGIAGQEAQGGREPARSALGGSLGRRPRSLEQHLDRLEVAMGGGLLDVVCPHGGGLAAGRPRGRRPAMSGQPQADRAGLVNGAADQGVPEAKPPWYLALAHEVARDQLVERPQRIRCRQTRDRDSEIELERVAGDSGGVRKRPRAGRDAVELTHDRRGDRRRDTRPTVGHPVRGAATGTRKFKHVEGIALARRVQALALCRTCADDERIRLPPCQRAELDRGDAVLERRGVERREESVIGLAGPVGGGDQHSRSGRSPQQMGGQLERGPVGPLDVVEDERHGLGHSEALDQLPHRMVRAEPLSGGRGPRPRAERAQRGKDARQLPLIVGGQPVEGVRLERGEVLVECIDHQAERQLTLELRCAARQGKEPGFVRHPQQQIHEPGLADPRLARNEQELRRSLTRFPEQLLEQFHLTITTRTEGSGCSDHIDFRPGRQHTSAVRARASVMLPPTSSFRLRIAPALYGPIIFEFLHVAVPSTTPSRLMK